MPTHWLVRSKIQHRLERLSQLEYSARLPISDITAWFSPQYVPHHELDPSLFSRFQPGTLWGADGKRGYFHLRFTVPADVAGEEVRLLLQTGGEGLCFRDGQPWQGVDWAHPEVLLADPAEGGEQFDLMVEVNPVKDYWGAKIPRPKPGDAKANEVLFSNADLVVVNKPVRTFRRAASLLNELATTLIEQSPAVRTMDRLKEQFYYELSPTVPESPYRAEHILQSLDNALDCLDVQAGEEGLAEQTNEALTLLDPVLKEPGAPNRFVVNALPNSHLDVVWMWTLDETVRKSARTLASTLRLLDQYPRYRFLFSQAILMQMVKDHFPRLYERVRNAVRDGRLDYTGAMWVEPDSNLPSGESLVRQLLLGNRFAREEFGRPSRLLYLPDVFGCSGALPQILAKAGVPYFMTVKIHTNEDNRFPYAWFWWEGIDGSRVLTHAPPSPMEKEFSPEMLLDVENRYPQHGEVNTTARPWGWGDGGGGPTEESVERIAHARDLAGLPRVQVQNAEDYFDEMAANAESLPVWRGEIYFERHRGTLTHQAETKRLSRRAELALYEAEILAVLTGHIPAAKFDRWWRSLCLQHFHDIVTGNSMTEVNVQARHALQRIVAESGSAIDECLAALAGSGDQLLIWNQLSWPRSELVQLPAQARDISWQAPDGRMLLTQATGDGTLALARDVPSVGYQRLSAGRSEDEQLASPVHLDGDEMSAANGFIKVRINEMGQLVSLYDLRADREVLSGVAVGNELRLHEDIPAPRLFGSLDGIEINAFYRKKFETLSADKVSLVEEGPLRVAWRCTYRFGRSRLVQQVRVYAHTARVDFESWIDWREDERLLRVYFPVDLNSERATFETQFGAVARSTHDNTSWDQSQFEVPAQKWADLSEEGYGVALLNDSRYGYAVKHGVMSLSLLRAPTYPDPVADRGEHRLVYSLYPHLGGYEYGGVVREAMSLNVPMRARMAGDGPRTHSYLELSGEHVVLSALKPAEDGQGAVLRLYEAHNRRGPVTVRGAIREAAETTLIEEPLESLPVIDGAFTFEARPYGIHTFRIS